ncbi:MAG: PotD/PotF family extracellular solute-binding protein, partial [Anaerolineae bacterium]
APAPTEAPATPQEAEAVEEEAAAEPAPVDQLYVFNWADYIDEELLTMYEEETGVKIIYDTYDSNEDLLAKLQAGAAGYDVIFPSDYMISQMIDLNLLAELDMSNIPNFQHVADFNKDPAYDPGNKFSVPYFWGTTGIGFKADTVDPEPDSWAVIFDPDLACQYEGGGINVLDDERELIGAALKYLGYSVNDADVEHLNQARDVILAAKPCWKTFDSSGYIDNLLIPGEVVLSHAWNGDVFVAAEEDESWTYVMPEEGGVIWQDNMAVPASSTRKAAAEHFINWLLDPEHNAQNTNYVFYASPNEAAREFIDPEILEDPAIYLDEETISRLEWIEPLSTEALTEWDRVWTEIKAQ